MKTILFILAGSGMLCLIPGAAALLELHPEAGWNIQLLWRGIGCHFVHFTGAHWFWDAAALAIVGFGLTEREVRLALALALPAVTLAVLAGSPELAAYRGLSGLDCALFALMAAKLTQSQPDWLRRLAWIAIAGFGLKTVWELLTGAAVFAGGGMLFEAVPLAHIAGAAAGFSAFGLEKWRLQRIVIRRNQPENEGRAAQHGQIGTGMAEECGVLSNLSDQFLRRQS